MGCSPKRTKVKGRRLELRIVEDLQAHGFTDVVHTGKTADQGRDVTLTLFGRLCRIQSKNFLPSLFKIYEALKRAEVVIVHDDRKEPLVVIPLSMWMDHLTWDRPPQDHSKAA